MAAIEDDLSANAARIAELEEEAAAKEKVMGEQRSACTGTEMMHEELDRDVNITPIAQKAYEMDFCNRLLRISINRGGGGSGQFCSKIFL